MSASPVHSVLCIATAYQVPSQIACLLLGFLQDQSRHSLRNSPRLHNRHSHLHRTRFFCSTWVVSGAIVAQRERDYNARHSDTDCMHCLFVSDISPSCISFLLSSSSSSSSSSSRQSRSAFGRARNLLWTPASASHHVAADLTSTFRNFSSKILVLSSVITVADALDGRSKTPQKSQGSRERVLQSRAVAESSCLLYKRHKRGTWEHSTIQV